MILLAGLIPVAGTYFCLQITVLDVKPYSSYIRASVSEKKNVPKCSGEMEPAGSSETYLSTSPYGVTSKKTRNLHVHHREDLIHLKKFHEFVTGALANCPFTRLVN